MDVTDDVTLQKMHKQISVLYQNQNLEWQNEDLRGRLSVADDELEHLRFKNSALTKHVEKLEKTAAYLHQNEADLCEIRTLLDKEQDMSKQREKMIQKFENVNYTLKQQNEKLIDKLDSHRSQIEHDKFNLHSMKTELQNLQYELEETQLELQQKDDVICQKNLVLKQLEESTEECLNFLTDLRLKNQELKDQLKERQEEDDLCADMRGTDGSSDLSLSFAEEMKLLDASDVEESKIEELPKPESPTAETKLTLQEMHKQIKVFYQNQSHLERLNEHLRFRLSMADDDLEYLRFKNAALAKHGEKLEKTAAYLHQTEADLCEIRTLLDKEQDMSKQREKIIQKSENANYTLRQQNEELIDELNSLQAQMEQDKFNLHSMKTELQNLQYEVGESQLELQQKDDVICQKNLVLKQLEESTEECLNFLTDLRLKNQELKDQLKERQEEDLWNCMMRGMDGSHDQSLSFAEEMKLLAASDVEESKIEELPKPESPSADSENQMIE